MYRVAIFGSGSGTNAQNILKYFEESEVARVHLVLTNKRSAGIIDRARPYGVPVVVFGRDQMESGMVAINRGIASDPAASFGGMKESGLGREGGFDGIHEFLETQYFAVDL